MQFLLSPIAVCTSIVCAAGAAVAQSSGALDPQFGLEIGLTATQLRGDAQAYDAVAMSDGGWVVFGTLRFSGEGKLPDRLVPVLTRYRADGSPVANFGTDGAALASLSGGEGGGVVLRDAVRLYQIVSDESRIHVLAYTLQGLPDLTYGVDGVATIEVGEYVYPVLDAVLQDGRVLVAASGREPNAAPSYQFLLARFTASGQPDGSFGQHGKRYYQVHDGAGARNIFTGLTLQADGKIVAAGRSAAPGADYDMTVARFDSNGKPDVTFGAGGFRVFSVLDVDFGRRLVVQSDGRLVIAGTICTWVDEPSYEDFCLSGAARLLPNGDLDTTFGTGGKVILALPRAEGEPFSESFVYGLEVDSQGRVLLMGAAQEDASLSAAYVARLTSAGTLDVTFGKGGVVANPYGGVSNDFGGSAAAGIVTQLHDGTRRLITVGGRRNTSGVRELVIARHFYDDGSED
jgi:uncharacterized delta-60 repeat protein